MTLNLAWHLTCPTNKVEEIVDLINKSHPADVTTRRDFKTGVSSLRLSFQQAAHIGDDKDKIFNERNFDAMTGTVQVALDKNFGSSVVFVPVNAVYQVPRTF